MHAPLAVVLAAVRQRRVLPNFEFLIEEGGVVVELDVTVEITGTRILDGDLEQAAAAQRRARVDQRLLGNLELTLLAGFWLRRVHRQGRARFGRCILQRCAVLHVLHCADAGAEIEREVERGRSTIGRYLQLGGALEALPVLGARPRRGGRGRYGRRAEDGSVAGDRIVELDLAVELGVARVLDGEAEFADPVVLAGDARLQQRKLACLRRRRLLRLNRRREGRLGRRRTLVVRLGGIPLDARRIVVRIGIRARFARRGYLLRCGRAGRRRRNVVGGIHVGDVRGCDGCRRRNRPGRLGREYALHLETFLTLRRQHARR